MDDLPGFEVWMTVEDVFHIQGRGTVYTGRLQGAGQLCVGDTATCDGVSWPVTKIEQFRAVVETAESGTNIGIMLRNGPAGDLLRGQTLQFWPRGADSGSDPQFTVIPAKAQAKKKRWGR